MPHQNLIWSSSNVNTVDLCLENLCKLVKIKWPGWWRSFLGWHQLLSYWNNVGGWALISWLFITRCYLSSRSGYKSLLSICLICTRKMSISIWPDRQRIDCLWPRDQDWNCPRRATDGVLLNISTKFQNKSEIVYVLRVSREKLSHGYWQIFRFDIPEVSK